MSDRGETLTRAGLGRRAAARFIDVLCMLMLYALTLAAVGFVLALGLLAIAAVGQQPARLA